jgi:serine/threonine protein kinase
MTSVGLDGFAPMTDDTPLWRELGKYRLLALVGRGGMGEIYLAMARGPSGFRKLVVVKCVRSSSLESEQVRRMFIDEGQLAARLQHPHVVQTHEVGIAEGVQYMAMEYLDGQPLSRIRRLVEPMKPRLAVRIVADALSGLHYAHELRDFDGTPLGIVHRDLSPPNIFVTYDGVVKLVDFGIAKTTLASRAMTEAGVLKGKIGYMAPEHVSRSKVDRRADVFAMGVVLWELLAHRRLVTDKAPLSALKFLLYGAFPSPSAMRPGIDPELDRIVARALERSVDARYATALEMRTDLEAFLARRGPPVREDDLANLMSSRFGGLREKREHELREWIAAAEGAPVRLPAEMVNSIGPQARDPENEEQESPLRKMGMSVVAALLFVLACVASYVLMSGAGRGPSPSAAAGGGALVITRPVSPHRLEPLPPVAGPLSVEPSRARPIGIEPTEKPAPPRESKSRPTPARPPAHVKPSGSASVDRAR